jgi:hypothetical protein
MASGQLRLYCSGPVCPSSDYSSMSPVPASFGHAKGTTSPRSETVSLPCRFRVETQLLRAGQVRFR